MSKNFNIFVIFVIWTINRYNVKILFGLTEDTIHMPQLIYN